MCVLFTERQSIFTASKSPWIKSLGIYFASLSRLDLDSGLEKEDSFKKFATKCLATTTPNHIWSSIQSKINPLSHQIRSILPLLGYERHFWGVGVRREYFWKTKIHPTVKIRSEDWSPPFCFCRRICSLICSLFAGFSFVFPAEWSDLFSLFLKIILGFSRAKN